MGRLNLPNVSMVKSISANFLRVGAMSILSRPTTNVHVSYLEAIKEYRAKGGYPDFDDLDVREPEAFRAHVAALRHDPRPQTAGLPAMTLFWWVDKTTYLGRISIWHQLAGPVADTGHIGFDIRPSARGRGHATAMLAAALPAAHQLGIAPALLTTEHTNLASRKVIEANDGQLINERDGRPYFHVLAARSLGHDAELRV